MLSSHRGKRIDSLSVSIMGPDHHTNMKSSTRMTTEAVLADLKQDSSFFNDDTHRRFIPAFEPQEVLSGKELGYGEFGIVTEVSELCPGGNCASCQDRATLRAGRMSIDSLLPLSAEFQVEDSEEEEEESEREKSLEPIAENNEATAFEKTTGTTEKTENETMSATSGASFHYENIEESYDEAVLAKNNTRKKMAANTHVDGLARYAVKRLKDEVDGKHCMDAAIDLACEAMFLQSISHTNIIHLRGTVGMPGAPGFAILLDRLVMTLEQKFSEWQAEKKVHQGSILGKLLCRKSETDLLENLLTERLLVCFDIARALRHLQRRKILYRDLKPSNCGFNVRGSKSDLYCTILALNRETFSLAFHNFSHRLSLSTRIKASKSSISGLRKNSSPWI